MSFSGEVKAEICQQIGSARHCQIAELAALLNFCATVAAFDNGSCRIRFRTEHEEVAGKYCLLLKRIFGIETVVTEAVDRRGMKLGGFQVMLDNSTDAVRVLQAVRLLDSNGNLAEEIPLTHQPTVQKSCCRRAFLRGTFLAAGSISDPNRSYHFEVSCMNETYAEQLLELICSLGVDAKIVQRKKYSVIYVKESSQISDLLGMMDAHVSMLNFENARIVREVRGNINRQVNCETANINKTANAAARQIEDIELIIQELGLHNLTNRLDEIAQIRLKYPSATLSEMGMMLEPPLGKSGVNHRLRKLTEIANKIREEKGI
ncbi:MAG: DNA-binding protein WhiA [Eubacteriales bacterium]|nr:DNA-binding protein WhiA [Eubacteriales bacterium]